MPSNGVTHTCQAKALAFERNRLAFAAVELPAAFPSWAPVRREVLGLSSHAAMQCPFRRIGGEAFITSDMEPGLQELGINIDKRWKSDNEVSCQGETVRG